MRIFADDRYEIQMFHNATTFEAAMNLLRDRTVHSWNMAVEPDGSKTYVVIWIVRD